MLRELTGLATSELAAYGRRRATQYGLYVLSAASFAASAAFLLGALHAILALSYGSAPAGFMMAAGMLALGLMLLMIGRFIRRRQPSVAASAAVAIAPLALSLIGPAVAKRIAR